jgi:flagellin FlaB
MKKVLRLFSRTAREERGITGLETAIILIAFVVVATVFAFVVLTTGVFSSERGKETVFAGLAKARGTMELRGGVVVTASGTTLTVDDIQFAVANAAGGDPIPVDDAPGAINTTIIAYRDSTVVDNDVTYTKTEIIGDGDDLLESGELFTLTVDVDGGDIAGSPTIDPNDRFTFELQTPVGAVIDITRQMPAELDAVMQLH